jgi:hypothetical protein
MLLTTGIRAHQERSQSLQTASFHISNRNYCIKTIEERYISFRYTLIPKGYQTIDFIKTAKYCCIKSIVHDTTPALVSEKRAFLCVFLLRLFSYSGDRLSLMCYGTYPYRMYYCIVLQQIALYVLTELNFYEGDYFIERQGLLCQPRIET